jgi:hypothetical protein
VGRNSSLSVVGQARYAIATGMKLGLDFKERARTLSAKQKLSAVDYWLSARSGAHYEHVYITILSGRKQESRMRYC